MSQILQGTTYAIKKISGVCLKFRFNNYFISVSVYSCVYLYKSGDPTSPPRWDQGPGTQVLTLSLAIPTQPLPTDGRPSVQCLCGAFTGLLGNQSQ